MRQLSFSALLAKAEDVEMIDAPSPSSGSSDLDLDLELSQLERDLSPGTDAQSWLDEDDVDLELRSPRTPTFTGESPHAHVPFDAERFMKSPLASPTSESSPLAALAYSPAAKSHLNLPARLIAGKENHAPTFPPPPKAPLLWIWTCHLCRSRYPLGATRRCLIDGHFYCSGDNSANQKNVKKKKRGQACSSEFDYVGWHDWGTWKEEVMALHQRTQPKSDSGPNLKGCGRCEYPSECRYERMNKVPEVVAALTKKVNCIVELEAKATAGTEKSTVSSKHEKKSLKVDTGSISGRRRKKNDQNGQRGKGNASDALRPAGESDCDQKGEIVTVQLDRGVESVTTRSSDPASPDLVDFSSMAIELESSTGEMLEKHCGKTGDVTGAQIIKIDELPELHRSRSTTRRQAEAKFELKQSRVTDFFGSKK